MVKKCSAQVNVRLGVLDATIADAIVRAADEVLAGKHADNFMLVREAPHAVRVRRDCCGCSHAHPLARFVPDDVPDGIGNSDQHERERGAVQPCHRDSGRCGRQQEARSPERPRQPGHGAYPARHWHCPPPPRPSMTSCLCGNAVSCAVLAELQRLVPDCHAHCCGHVCARDNADRYVVGRDANPCQFPRMRAPTRPCACCEPIQA